MPAQIQDTNANSKNNDFTIYHFQGASSLAANIVTKWTNQDAHVALPAHTMAGLGNDYADRVNPAAAVPSLVLPSGDVVTQNVAVLNFIAKKAGRQDLVGGDDLLDQANVLKWTSFLASDVHSSFWVVFFSDRYTTSKDSETLAMTKSAGIQLVQNKMAILERHLEGREWIVTDHKTVADAHAFVFIRWMLAFFTDSMKDFPNLKALADRMEADKGVQEALKYEDKELWGFKDN